MINVVEQINTKNNNINKSKIDSTLSKTKKLIECGIYNKNIINNGEKDFSFNIEKNINVENTTFVDYYKNLSETNNNFIISEIDEKDKYSVEYINCTSVIATGKSKITGENISFITHQNPHALKGNYFKPALKNQLIELKKISEIDSIDIVIIGGNSNNNFEEYNQSIKSLNIIIKKITGKNTEILGGPSGIKEADGDNEKDIYLDTKNRRVHYYKHHVEQESNIDFNSKNIDNIVKTLKGNNDNSDKMHKHNIISPNTLSIIKKNTKVLF